MTENVYSIVFSSAQLQECMFNILLQVFSVRNLNDQPLTQFQVAFDNNVVGIQPASQVSRCLCCTVSHAHAKLASF
jgi:hypothetical protein